MGDSVAGCLRTSQQFYELLSYKDRGPQKLASVFNAQARASHARSYYEASREALPKDYYYGELNQLIGTADLVADLARGIQIRITTEALIGGLWWQLAQKLSEKVPGISECPPVAMHSLRRVQAQVDTLTLHSAAMITRSGISAWRVPKERNANRNVAFDESDVVGCFEGRGDAAGKSL